MRWARAGRPKRGEVVSGDESIVHSVGEATLVGVIDGLGHGPQAALASRTASDFLRENAAPDLEDLIRRCGRAISHTRGAAATLVWIEGETLRHVGVGNVELMSVSRHPIRPFSSPGILGRGLRKLIVTEHRVSAGDVVALYTDGISSRFDLEPLKRLGAEAIATHILMNQSKDHDDATCVILTF